MSTLLLTWSFKFLWASVFWLFTANRRWFMVQMVMLKITSNAIGKAFGLISDHNRCIIIKFLKFCFINSFKTNKLERKLEVVPQLSYDEFRVADMGHICQEVKWSLVSLHMLDFKERKPKILAAIRPEFEHEILNGSFSSRIANIPNS